MSPRTHTLSAEEKQQIVAAIQAELSAQPNVAFAYLYGSFVEDRPFRDIDIGIYLTNSKQPETKNQQPKASNLSVRLTADLNLPADVRILNDAPVTFLFHVFQGQLILSRDEDLLTDMLEETARRYLDMEPLLRRATKEAFGA